MVMRASTDTTKNCRHCGVALDPRGPNFKIKKHCSLACYRAARKTPEALKARFWAKVDKSAGPEACWPYTGSITSHGYGCAQSGNGRVIGAHKLAYLLTKGIVADGLHVMHSCDYRRCCNPSHLSIGTRQDNMDDMAVKGRGRKDQSRKLDADKARAIKALKGKASSGEIAKQFGITQSYVFGIWAGRCWRTA